MIVVTHYQWTTYMSYGNHFKHEQQLKSGNSLFPWLHTLKQKTCSNVFKVILFTNGIFTVCEMFVCGGGEGGRITLL